MFRSSFSSLRLQISSALLEVTSSSSYCWSSFSFSLYSPYWRREKRRKRKSDDYNRIINTPTKKPRRLPCLFSFSSSSPVPPRSWRWLSSLSNLSASLLRSSLPASSLFSSSFPSSSSSFLWGERGSRRYFSYEETLAFRLRGYKPLVMIIHPVLKRQPYREAVWDAEEALGLARAVKWDLLPGPSEPRGGWNEDALQKVEHIKYLKSLNRLSLPGDWHVDRGDESDKEFDIDDETWHSPTLREQWAESCIVRIRLQELSDIFSQQPSQYVFINHSLTASQHRNLELLFNNALAVWKKTYDTSSLSSTEAGEDEEISGMTAEERLRIPQMVEVIDRQRIVLEIFALRAKSRQAQLQVDLAKANYLRTRLSAGSRSRQKELMNLTRDRFGGSETYKKWVATVTSEYHFSGETFMEFERRMIDDTLKKIRTELQDIRQSRKIHREGRRGTGTIALVGYTNAGKTALMNHFTGGELKVRDLLFQTLDTTFRRFRLPSGTNAILADSVGFIQALPHSLYDAFQATLEEIAVADVMLHVRDISHPQTELQKSTVLETLRDVGISNEKLETSLIEVWNKVDLLPESEIKILMERLPANAVPTCATDGSGCDVLLQLIEQLLNALGCRSTLQLTFPTFSAGERLRFLHRHFSILEESLQTSEDGQQMSVEVLGDRDALAKYYKTFGEDEDEEEAMTEADERRRGGGLLLLKKFTKGESTKTE